MARVAKPDTAAKLSKSTALVNWEEELAKQAEIAAGMEAKSGGGQFFSMQGGQLKFNDAQMPGNQMAVIIVDHIFENIFFEGRYDPDNPAPPTCFAFGRDDEMAPHESVIAANQAVNESCKECPHNQWGSSDVGRGKACRNIRRLALIPAGSFDAQNRFQWIDNDDHFASATLAYMKLPVTSINGFAGFVKQVAGTLRRPPHGIVTRIRTEADPKTQFRVIFEPLCEVPSSLLPIIMKRNQEAKSQIEFPYNLEMEERQQPARGRAAPSRGGAKGKPAVQQQSRGRKY
jgi:hypothetical protein